MVWTIPLSKRKTKVVKNAYSTFKNLGKYDHLRVCNLPRKSCINNEFQILKIFYFFIRARAFYFL